ncbi:trichohyalin-like [Procambarus clarkii]|uniref:trichohyalin-like n=1 Tax=Procambarus clarkii TaxID=6728 RepID=UPI0037443CBA
MESPPEETHKETGKGSEVCASMSFSELLLLTLKREEREAEAQQRKQEREAQLRREEHEREFRLRQQEIEANKQVELKRAELGLGAPAPPQQEDRRARERDLRVFIPNEAEGFFDQFEKIATLKKWPRAEWAELVQRKSYAETARDMERKFLKWLESEKARSAEEVKRLMVMEKFMSGLSPEIRLKREEREAEAQQRKQEREAQLRREEHEREFRLRQQEIEANKQVELKRAELGLGAPAPPQQEDRRARERDLRVFIPNEAEGFFDQFEKIATLKKWPRAEWAELVQISIGREYVFHRGSKVMMSRCLCQSIPRRSPNSTQHTACFN